MLGGGRSLKLDKQKSKTNILLEITNSDKPRIQDRDYFRKLFLNKYEINYLFSITKYLSVIPTSKEYNV